METNENKYVKDQADPLPDTHGLDELFNVAPTENNQVIDMGTGEILDGIEQVKEMRKELQELEKEVTDVDSIIVSNIDRANRLLDKLEEDMTGDRGSYSASLVESVATLINAVTSAANSVTGISVGQETLRQKERALDLKEREIGLKSIIKGSTGDTTITNNNLVMNREDLMKMIKGETE